MYTRAELKELSFIDTSKTQKFTKKDFYKSKEWTTKSTSLLRQHPFCELCLNEGKKSESSLVHHIIPLSQGGSELSEDNLICLCDSCHGDIHSTIGVRISREFLLDALLNKDEYEDEWEPHINLIAHDRQTVRLQWMKAKELEQVDPDKAVAIYQKIMFFLERFDNWCKRHTAEMWRSTRYPINRLTIVLERQKKYKECLKEIKKYEQIDDELGLPSGEMNSINKRKDRVVKLLSL